MTRRRDSRRRVAPRAGSPCMRMPGHRHGSRAPQSTDTGWDETTHATPYTRADAQGTSTQRAALAATALAWVPKLVAMPACCLTHAAPDMIHGRRAGDVVGRCDCEAACLVERARQVTGGRLGGRPGT